ncbi:glycyl-radical enzyme activating protein [Bacteroidia bacterium]|nr:glycyl-radical enzyme activating protein [Bacteroidia bacterium]
MSKTGLVFDIHRGTTHDGPGMRTTIFMKGCPLHCEWCHNPESLSREPETQWISRKCIGCNICVESCVSHALTFDETGATINTTTCEHCRQCVKNCPTGAQTLIGKYWTAEELVKEACKDSLFFGEFEGGVTVSGGEPLLQYEFVHEFLQLLKQKGENTALDTSGFSSPKALEVVYPYVDIFLYDIKFIDRELHQKHTGVDNNQILKNFQWLVQKSKNDTNKRIRIRTPLIPGATAMVENIQQIGEFLRNNLADEIECWELCAFNNVSRDKYARMRLDWLYSSTPLMSEKEIDTLRKTAQIYLPQKVLSTGLSAKF